MLHVTSASWHADSKGLPCLSSVYVAQPEDAEQYEPEELRQLGPRNLSFWIASNFRETPQQQQILLQVDSMHDLEIACICA